MRTVTLKDGTQYELDWCNADKGVLNINVVSTDSIVELAAKFGNREINCEIHASYGESQPEMIYEGYTELYSIMVDSWRTGTTMIMLMTPERKAQDI